MGSAISQSPSTRRRNVGGNQGNLLVEGFVNYAVGDKDWTKVKSNSRVHLEVLLADKPLGTWRGTITLDGVSLEDLQSYIGFKLGSDKFELLAVTEDDEFVFRDMFDFTNLPADVVVPSRRSFYNLASTSPPPLPPTQASGNNRHSTHAGDHRGENSELFDVKARKDSEPYEGKDRRVSHLAASGGDNRKPSTNEDDEDDEQEEEDENQPDEHHPLLSELEDISFHPSSTRSLANENSASNLLGSANTTTWWGIKFPSPNSGSSRQNSKLSTGSGVAGERTSARMSKKGSKLNLFSSPTSARGSNAQASAMLREAPLARELIFKRQDFILESTRPGERTVVTIAQSCKGYGNIHTLSSSAVTTKGQMKLMGTMVHESAPHYKFKTPVPKCTLTFVCSMDAQLADWETDLATAHALGHFGGKAKVERFLVDAQEFFRSKQNRLMLRFRQLAGASLGEMGWKEVERSKNELQLGTNVIHPKYGHGVVQSFDMKGRVKVAYDSKEMINHPPEEKDELKVSVLIGTRVKHRNKGFGTVKAFDESGRVHVKFDNGDFHRYKQAAWKKKMHMVKMIGIGGALGTVKLSWRPIENVREGMGRVKFAVGVTTDAVLAYILESSSVSSADDLKGGAIIERRIVERIGENELIVYEHRKMPPPLASRDFVFSLIWGEVAPKTFVVVMESISRNDLPEQTKTVRGETHLSGWLLEPLYLDRVSADGADHICRLTYQLCIDTKGFVAPDSVEAVRLALLLAAVTDTRAYFWEQSQLKHVVNKHQEQLEKMLSKKEKNGGGGPKLVKPTRSSLEGSVEEALQSTSSREIPATRPSMLDNSGWSSDRRIAAYVE
ncbi:hypothetical protein BASA81_003291 [Batrachochytrium salamandrivorans]|nr:hypothetical protein BASA81_003291 [Batrachochytrium salamandrivorans]